MPWLTPNVFKQARTESLINLPSFADGDQYIQFRHIVHAYKDLVVPENTVVQALTFDSIRAAAQFAAPDYNVTCVAVIYPEDSDLIPNGVTIAPPLRRFVTDVSDFNAKRPLPLLFDIIHHGATAARTTAEQSEKSEYIVLTNSDIHLQPGFYRIMAALIRDGYDVITVNRRTIDVGKENRTLSPIFMAEIGSDHAGFDCFVFPTSMLKDFSDSECCCGAGYVMRSLLFNLVAHAHRFLMLTHAHMTYHLGDDRYWADPMFADYLEFNISQAKKVITELAKDPVKAKRLVEFVAAHEQLQFQDIIS